MRPTYPGKFHFLPAIVLLAAFLTHFCQTTVLAATNRKTTIEKTTRVITFAYFPMAVPVAVLGEVLKRDLVLQKALERSGSTITFKTFAKGNDVLPLIRQGRIDSVMFADFPSIEAATTGDMLIIGKVKQSYASVVAPQGTSIDQLRKSKVGNAFGSTSHYALLQALNAAGLSENEITLVPLEVNQMADALAAGSIDAFAAWEPTPTAAFNKYPGQFANIHRQLSNSFFLISSRLANEKPAAAEALAAALIRSVRWLKKGNNLATASGWALAGMHNFNGEATSLTVADVSAITRNDLLDISRVPMLSSTGADKQSLFFKEFDFLKKIGKLPAEASAARLRSSFRDDLLPRLIKNPDRYQLNTFHYAP